MPKTKSNGHATPATPATSAPPAAPQDPFDQAKLLIQKMGDRRYAEGYRRATHLIAHAVGQLDPDSKAKLTKAFDLLEAELLKAEAAVQ